MKSDYLAHVRKIFDSLEVPSAINSTLITLIPKMENPTRVNHFRPINLVNSSYKMITKILVYRIRPHLHDIISPNQNNFIPGRESKVHKFYNCFRNYPFHFIKKGKKGLFALKLDLKKAYDRLEWSFIEHCLHYFHFSNASIKLIMSCVSSV